MIIEDLVEKAKNGDKDAYSVLIESIQSDLYKIAKARLKCEADTQDVVQDTVIKAYLNLSKLKHNKNFKTWIIRILINECNKFYRNRKRRDELTLKYSVDSNATALMEDKVDFDTMKKVLNEKEKKIIELYADGYSIKQIAKKLGINENTVKTNLSRGRLKLKKAYSPASIFMFILCVLIATSVVAVSIISYIKSLFELNSVGIDNDGVLMTIENMDWYQQVDMDYIDLGDDYKIRMEYLLMDEMNLYMVFDFTSEKDISKFTDVAPTDLRIVNESGDVICNRFNVFEKQYTKKFGYKLINKSKNNMKVLIYMYTDKFPVSKILNISFSKVDLTKKLSSKLSIENDVNFEVELLNKFIDRKYTSYSSINDNLEKAIVTETGFHAIINTDSETLKDIKLIDELGNYYKCYSENLIYYSDYGFKYIVISNFNSINFKTLKLVIDGTEYDLTR